MTGVFVIDPRPMKIKDWTDAMTINLERFGGIPILQNEKKWQEWGASISQLSSLSGTDVPNPYEFSDWQVWAQRLNETLSAIT